MTSPDILDQNPYSSQSYNRYSYVGNNPLKYVDPSGYRWVNNYYWVDDNYIGVDGVWTVRATKVSNWYWVSDFNDEGFYQDEGGNTGGNTGGCGGPQPSLPVGVPDGKGKKADVGDGFNGMDYANSTASLTGTFVGGVQYAVGAVRSQSLWGASYKTSKALKAVGVNVQPRVIKHGAKTVLANASKKIAIVGGVLAVTDVFMDGQVNASHLLNMGMVGVSVIPGFGWVAGGVYFASDMITIGVSGQSIGQHLDNYVGASLYDF